MEPTLRAVKGSYVDCPLFCCGLEEIPLIPLLLPIWTPAPVSTSWTISGSPSPQSSPQAHSDCKSLRCASQPFLPPFSPLCHTGFMVKKLAPGLEWPLQVMIPLLWDSCLETGSSPEPTSTQLSSRSPSLSHWVLSTCL